MHSRSLFSRRFLVLSAAAIVTGLTLTGCPGSGGSGKGVAADGHIPGVLRYALQAEPTTLDPALVSDGPTIDSLQQVYEGLLGWNDKNELTPLVAAAMPKVSADGRTYTFTIRDSVTFHNGRKVTAKDVQYSLIRSLDPALNSPVVMSYLNDIVGAKEYNARKAKTVSGIKVIDDKTVAITIDKPRAYFLGKLTYPTGYIVAQEEVEKGEKNEAGAFPITETNTVGTGPFKLEAYVKQDKLTLAANEAYWDGKPKLTKIERPIVLKAQTERNLYDEGQLDICTLDKADYEKDRENPAIKDQVKLFDRAATFYAGLNQTHYAPFKDKRVRQAFAYAINKDAIVNDVMLGTVQRAEGVVPAGIPGFNKDFKGIPYNVAKAKELLAAAGYPEGKGLPPLTLTFRESRPDLSKAAQVIQQQLKEVGVQVNLNEMEWGSFLKATDNKEVDFFHMRWSADYLDQQNFLSVLLHSNVPENRTGYSNPAYDKLLDEADASTDPKKRIELYRKAEAMVVDDAPWVPLYYQRDMELIKPYVTDIRDSLMGHLPHKTTVVQ